MESGELFERIELENPKAAYPSDMKEAIIGIVRRKGMESQVLLDESKCISILMSQGMNEEEAQEFFDYNTADAFIGEDSTPCFADLVRKSYKEKNLEAISIVNNLAKEVLRDTHLENFESVLSMLKDCT